MRIDLSLSLEQPLPGMDAAALKKIIRETCTRAFPNVFTSGVTVMVEIASVSDETMQMLNKTYRKKNKPTDILSFGTLTSPEETKKLKAKRIDLGQIVVAPNFIRHYAKEDGVAWKHEFTFVLSHGLLHLMGYDHSDPMFALQDEVTEKMVQSKKI